MLTHMLLRCCITILINSKLHPNVYFVYCYFCLLQNDVSTDFDTRMLFSHLCAEGGTFLYSHLKREFKACTL